MSNPTHPPTSPENLNPNLAIPDTASSSTDNDPSVNSLPQSTHSLSTHRVHAIVAGISLAICLLLLLALFLLYGRYRTLKNSYEANQTRPKLTARGEATSSFSQIGNAIVGRWKYSEKQREPPVIPRTKVPFQIKTEPQSAHSRSTRNPHPYIHSYHHTEGHSSPSGSSASSFDGISPLDATFLFGNSIGRKNLPFPNSPQMDLSRFADRASSEAYQRALHARHTNGIENYQLQPIPKVPNLRCLPSTTLQDLEMFVSQVEHEFNRICPKSGRIISKVETEVEKQHSKTSQEDESKSVSRNSAESSPDHKDEVRKSMIGRGESYYWKNPPRFDIP